MSDKRSKPNLRESIEHGGQALLNSIDSYEDNSQHVLIENILAHHLANIDSKIELGIFHWPKKHLLNENMIPLSFAFRRKARLPEKRDQGTEKVTHLKNYLSLKTFQCAMQQIWKTKLVSMTWGPTKGKRR